MNGPVADIAGYGCLGMMQTPHCAGTMEPRAGVGRTGWRAVKEEENSEP